ncbi:hypothetical protein ROZALSC1DRAFT_31476 [Rozella allomycis CSF55]|uniref:Helitron helicase-like domain-containing protein n=1 Tax=Rozella allomycis (strain CSF55) TaxID=988480 RepID=A0A075B198_ROZAC|nr:hypothetical protein O9G_005848 [Rozella allomycis CSF55]RKP16616.1 hypothetical protein ROZALSC1DRAFT_31476 [Rozella allomycis CSF55]|eukprot:EPZ36366.1 hypothetical protein O9G_005848 [Rozella allomycis CSF55]
MNDDPAKFAQIFFYDSQAQNERRLQIFPTLDPFVYNTIGDLLHRINPYVMLFQHLRKIQAPEICLQLKANSPMDLRRHNLPTADDVSVLIIDNENEKNKREFILRHRDNSLKTISELSRHYDPLQYPLLFPHGESGWTPNFMNTRGRRITQLQ